MFEAVWTGLLALAVAGVAAAAGRNLIRTAEESATAEADLFGSGPRYARVRAWNYRFCGAVLLAVSVIVLIGGALTASRAALH